MSQKNVNLSAEKKTNFVTGAAMLGITGLLVKIIGAFYRVPLTNIIGLEGVALYHVAYNIYAFLLMISTAGLPAAISRQVAERLALGDAQGAHRTFKLSFIILIGLGGLASGIVLVFNEFFATTMGNAEAALAVTAIAPSLFFVAAFSAFRGYFQGMQRMTPTAVSQVVEQVGKLALGLYFAALWLPKGAVYGAAGAMFGVTLSEAAAFIMLLGTYFLRRKRMITAVKQSTFRGKQQTLAQIGKALAIIAIPITIGACITPIVNLIDSMLVMNRLTGIGYTSEAAKDLYGLLTGVVNTLANMPAVFTIALSTSLVPALSAFRAKRDVRSLQSTVGVGLKLSILIGLPCSIGLFLLAKPIISMLYPILTPAQVQTASVMMGIMAIGVFMLSVLQTMSGALQGLGKASLPVINLFIGAVVKVAVNYILLGTPAIGIYGAPVGTAVCYSVAAVLDLYFVIRGTKMKIHFPTVVFKPVLAVGAMAAVVLGAQWAIGFVTKSNAVTTLFCVGAGAVVYLVLLLVLGAITPEDTTFIPGGGKLSRLMHKLKIWK